MATKNYEINRNNTLTITIKDFTIDNNPQDFTTYSITMIITPANSTSTIQTLNPTTQQPNLLVFKYQANTNHQALDYYVRFVKEDNTQDYLTGRILVRPAP